MTVTTLDPRTALIVVDLQNGVVGLSTAHPIADVVARSAELIRAFRSHDLPVVLVNATGGAPGRTESPRRVAAVQQEGAADLVAELDARPEDIYVSKQTWGAFHNTGLHEELQKRGVSQVVVVGAATSAGVESTARAAHEHGYNVTFATDAMTDMNADAHENSVTRIFPRIGESGSAAEIIALLDA